MSRQTTTHPISAPTAGSASAHSPAVQRRWARFLAGLSAILLFAFAVVPALQRLGPVREVREAIQSAGVDATALFYTESDVSAEAEASIRDALRYSARRRKTDEPSPQR